MKDICQVQKPVVRPRSILHEIRLGAIASMIGSILFVFLTFICIYAERPIEDRAEIMDALYAWYIIIGPIIGFAITVLPSIAGGILITTLLRIWVGFYGWTKTPVVFVGVVIGGLLGFLIVEIVYFEQYGFWNDTCVLFSSIIAGAGAGGWFVWEMRNWLKEGDTSGEINPESEAKMTAP